MPGGTFPKKGEIFRNPGLASTLEAIATRGRDEFYKGPIAAAIAAHIKAQGGFLSVEDFAAHTSDWVTPVSTMYRGYRVWELPPNTQGSAVLQMLNVLEGVDLVEGRLRQRGSRALVRRGQEAGVRGSRQRVRGAAVHARVRSINCSRRTTRRRAARS